MAVHLIQCMGVEVHMLEAALALDLSTLTLKEPVRHLWGRLAKVAGATLHIII